MIWTLSREQRIHLRHQMNTTTDARACRRCAALLRLDQGQPVAAVAQEFQVTRQTLYNWRSRVNDSSDGLLSDSPRQGRPSIWNDQRTDLLEQLLSESPRCHGFQSTGWTARLLQARLKQLCQWDVSDYSLREKIHQLGYVWKRFRYTLIPDPQREKKKTHPQPYQDVA